MGLSYTLKFILILYISCNVYSFAHKPELTLWCRYCSTAVGDTSQISNRLSPGATKVESRYMFGKNVTVQTLVNPFLFKFDVITAENASCEDVGHSNGGPGTWFPGYAWRICKCPRCSSQLGWTFEKELGNNVEGPIDTKKTFHVLMLKSLFGLTEDDDSGTEILNFAKFYKPLKRSTLPPFRLRASELTAATKEDVVTSVKAIDIKNNVTMKGKTVTETNNGINEGTTIVFTRTRNISDSQRNISLTIDTNDTTTRTVTL